MHTMFKLMGAALVTGLLATSAHADQSQVVQARETLAKLREARAQRGAGPGAPATETWGHHLKKPEIRDEPVEKVPEKKPELQVNGTMRMGDRLEVFVGRDSFRVGDEIKDGYRVYSISPTRLIIERGSVRHEYPIR